MMKSAKVKSDFELFECILKDQYFSRDEIVSKDWKNMRKFRTQVVRWLETDTAKQATYADSELESWCRTRFYGELTKTQILKTAASCLVCNTSNNKRTGFNARSALELMQKFFGDSDQLTQFICAVRLLYIAEGKYRYTKLAESPNFTE